MPTKDEKAISEWKKRSKEVFPYFIAQLVIAALLLVIIYYGGYYYCDFIPLPKSSDFSGKLQFSLQWCAFPFAGLLFYTISQVGNKRGSTPASDPLAGNEHYIQLEKNILSNTLEQTTLAFFLVMALAVYLEQDEMKLVPIFLVTFIVGRVLFIVGYKISSVSRVCGVTMNFGSSFFVFCLIGYFTYSRGLMAAGNSGKDEL